MATKKTGNGPAKRKVSAPKPRGRSADAAAGAAVVKARGRAKATGQTPTSSMDAITRRYKKDPSEWDNARTDRLSGVSTEGKYKFVSDRKTAQKVGGMTAYAARRSADKRAGLSWNPYLGPVMSKEAAAYERKMSSTTKRGSAKKSKKK